MIKLIAYSTEVKGELVNYEEGPDDTMIFRLKLYGPVHHLEIPYPAIAKPFLETIKRTNRTVLQDATVDFNTQLITFNAPIQSDGQSMKRAERAKATRHRAKITRIL